MRQVFWIPLLALTLTGCAVNEDEAEYTPPGQTETPTLPSPAPSVSSQAINYAKAVCELMTAVHALVVSAQPSVPSALPPTLTIDGGDFSYVDGHPITHGTIEIDAIPNDRFENGSTVHVHWHFKRTYDSDQGDEEITGEGDAYITFESERDGTLTIEGSLAQSNSTCTLTNDYEGAVENFRVRFPSFGYFNPFEPPGLFSEEIELQLAFPFLSTGLHVVFKPEVGVDSVSSILGTDFRKVAEDALEALDHDQPGVFDVDIEFDDVTTNDPPIAVPSEVWTIEAFPALNRLRVGRVNPASLTAMSFLAMLKPGTTDEYEFEVTSTMEFGETVQEAGTITIENGQTSPTASVEWVVSQNDGSGPVIPFFEVTATATRR